MLIIIYRAHQKLPHSQNYAHSVQTQNHYKKKKTSCFQSTSLSYYFAMPGSPANIFDSTHHPTDTLHTGSARWLQKGNKEWNEVQRRLGTNEVERSLGSNEVERGSNEVREDKDQMKLKGL